MSARPVVTVRPSPFGWVVVGTIALSVLVVAFCALCVAVAAAQGKLDRPAPAAPPAAVAVTVPSGPAASCEPVADQVVCVWASGEVTAGPAEDSQAPLVPAGPVEVP